MRGVSSVTDARVPGPGLSMAAPTDDLNIAAVYLASLISLRSYKNALIGAAGRTHRGRTDKSQVGRKNALETKPCPICPTFPTFYRIVGNMLSWRVRVCHAAARLPHEFPETGRQIGQVGQLTDIAGGIHPRGRPG
jgi:hypothetical protein